MTDEPIADPTLRFSERVEHYVRSRPTYPDIVVETLEREVNHHAGDVLADVGSGTGLLAVPFLRRGTTVIGIEPNANMRAAAEKFLAAYSNYTIVDGRAEATGLGSASVDGVIAGQSFHWFDPLPTRREFSRILRPGGWVSLIWNRRRIYSNPFLEQLEEFLLEHGTDYRQVDHTKIRMEEIRRFFDHDGVELRSFDNEQRLDRDGLISRVLSASYVPAQGHAGHEPMLEALGRLFDEHQVDGTVRMEYDTLVYFGRLDPAAPDA